jgi:hypothetical protein
VLALTRTFERKIVTSQLKSADLRLSPVDFGSHNILVHQGKSTFVDFEDFGWDDPMQLVAYATPALSSKNKNYLMNNYVAKSPLPEYVTRRLPITMQLRELHWISRLLLGLTPSVIKKRQFAIGDFNLENYLSTQYGRISYHIEQLS